MILVIGLTSKKFKANLSKKGFGISGDKTQEKDKVKVKKVKKKSKIDVKTKKDQDIDIEDIDNSDVTIK